MNAAIRKANSEKNKKAKKKCADEKQLWEAGHRMYGKKLSKLKLAQLKLDWRMIRVKLGLNVPFEAQLLACDLSLRTAAKNNNNAAAVNVARGFRFEDDPPHDEENPSYAVLFERAKTGDQQKEVRDSLLQAWFGSETVDKLDEDAADEDGGPLGELCWEFLVQYRRHCELILKGTATPIQGLLGEATDIILQGCRITVSLIKTEPHILGTQYEETFNSFLTERDQRYDIELEHYVELMGDAQKWKPKICSYIVDACNDDATGPRFQSMMKRCVVEKATVALVQEAKSELEWLTKQKRRPGAYNRLFIKVAKVCVDIASGKEASMKIEDATVIVEAIKLCKKYTDTKKLPSQVDSLLAALDTRSSKERKKKIVDEIAEMCRNFDGTDTELKDFHEKIDQIQDCNDLPAGFVQELKDVRGTVVTKMVRLVRNTQQRTESFQTTVKRQIALIGSITSNEMIQKDDEDAKEPIVARFCVSLTDQIMNMKDSSKDLEADLEDAPDITSGAFRKKLDGANETCDQYKQVCAEAKDKGLEGGLVATLTTPGDEICAKNSKFIETQCNRIDEALQIAIERETKRVVRVAYGGDKSDWKEDLDGSEKLTDQAFVVKCKELEKTFHESDFLERMQALKKEPVLASNGAHTTWLATFATSACVVVPRLYSRSYLHRLVQCCDCTCGACCQCMCARA